MKNKVVAFIALPIVFLIVLNPANILEKGKEKVKGWFSGAKELPGDVKEMAQQALDTHTLAMLDAVDAGEHKKAQALLAIGADVNGTIPYGNGNTALMSASGNGDYQMVTILLKAGADVNAANDSGYTSLMRAARNGHVKIVATLLNAGANADAVDNTGFKAFDYAEQMQKGNPEKEDYNLIVELLTPYTTLM